MSQDLFCTDLHCSIGRSEAGNSSFVQQPIDCRRDCRCRMESRGASSINLVSKTLFFDNDVCAIDFSSPNKYAYTLITKLPYTKKRWL